MLILCFTSGSSHDRVNGTDGILSGPELENNSVVGVKHVFSLYGGTVIILTSSTMMWGASSPAST